MKTFLFPFSSLSVLFDFQFAHKSPRAGGLFSLNWSLPSLHFLLIGAHMASLEFANVSSKFGNHLETYLKKFLSKFLNIFVKTNILDMLWPCCKMTWIYLLKYSRREGFRWAVQYHHDAPTTTSTGNGYFPHSYHIPHATYHIPKVQSVENGKIPTKKVKVDLFQSKMWSFNLEYTGSTQQGAEPVKKTCTCWNF